MKINIPMVAEAAKNSDVTNDKGKAQIERAFKKAKFYRVQVTAHGSYYTIGAHLKDKSDVSLIMTMSKKDGAWTPTSAEIQPSDLDLKNRGSYSAPKGYKVSGTISEVLSHIIEIVKTRAAKPFKVRAGDFGGAAPVHPKRPGTHVVNTEKGSAVTKAKTLRALIKERDQVMADFDRRIAELKNASSTKRGGTKVVASKWYLLNVAASDLAITAGPFDSEAEAKKALKSRKSGGREEVVSGRDAIKEGILTFKLVEKTVSVKTRK